MMRLLRKLGISNKSVESNTRPEGEDQKRKSKGFRFFVFAIFENIFNLENY